MDSKEILHKGIMYYRAYCKQCQRWEIYSFGDLVCGQATSDNGEGGEFANWGELVYLLKDGTGIFADDICKSKTIYDKLWVIQKRVDPEFIGFIPRKLALIIYLIS